MSKDVYKRQAVGLVVLGIKTKGFRILPPELNL